MLVRLIIDNDFAFTVFNSTHDIRLTINSVVEQGRITCRHVDRTHTVSHRTDTQGKLRRVVGHLDPVKLHVVFRVLYS